jgi:AcrR family transcriptional regulator
VSPDRLDPERSAVPRRQPPDRAALASQERDGSAKRSTKRRIEDAALHLFATRGFEATGIRDIADQAGISTAALYHYMGSKDELLIDFMLVSMTQLIRVAHEALAGAEGPAGELACLVRVHVGFHAMDSQRSLVADDELRALSEEAFARVIRLRDNYERLWADTLERGQRSGVFRLADARVARLALLEMCNGVARWFSRKGPLSPAELADAFTDLALGMARAESDQRPLRRTDIMCLPTNDILAIIERELRDGSEAAAPGPTRPTRPRSLTPAASRISRSGCPSD